MKISQICVYSVCCCCCFVVVARPGTVITEGETVIDGRRLSAAEEALSRVDSEV